MAEKGTIPDAIEEIRKTLNSDEYKNNEVFILIPKIFLGSDASVQKYFDDFEELALYSRLHEPGTLKFGALENEKDGSIWALEHFESEQALALHRESPKLGPMLSWLQADMMNSPHPLPIPAPMRLIQPTYTHKDANEANKPLMIVYKVKLGDSVARSAGTRHDRSHLHFGTGEEDNIVLVLQGTTETELWLMVGLRRGCDVDRVSAMFRESLENEHARASIEQSKLELVVGFLGL